MPTTPPDQGALKDLYVPCSGQPEVDEHCTCPSTSCQVHGQCCACVAWHRDSGLKPLPHCLRDLPEVTWRGRDNYPAKAIGR
jgi:hypothetical protein